MSRLARLLGPLILAFLAPAYAGAQDGGTAEKTFWLPPRASGNIVPVRIDELFYIILYITAVAAVLVFAALIWFVFRYRGRPGQKGRFVHGNHTIELVWTIVPAAILLWLAIVQVDDWRMAKVPSEFPSPAESTVVQVAAQQFDWSFRHAGQDGKFESYDLRKAEAGLEKAKNDREEQIASGDYDPENDPLEEYSPFRNSYFGSEDDDDVVSATLKVPVNKPVLIELRSIDVIHSFYIPTMRLKQDAVPGKPMPVWFLPTQIGRYEIACAELCGNNHTTMRAWLEVVSQEEFDSYIRTESEKKFGSVDRLSENQWNVWPMQGLVESVGGEPVRPWTRLKLERQKALSGKKAE